MKVELWTLSVTSYTSDMEPIVTVHKSLDEAMAELRENFDPEGDYAELSDAHMMAALLDDQGIQASASWHELEI